jgi:imidazolonepropionase-like amidohydrolase
MVVSMRGGPCETRRVDVSQPWFVRQRRKCQAGGFLAKRQRRRRVPDMNLILQDGQLVDGTGARYARATVLVAGRTIRDVALGASLPAPAGFTAIDCRGKTILPGMFDVHVHLGGGDVVPGIEDYRVNRRLDEHLAMHAYRSLEASQRALRAGFTTLREMSTREFVDVQLRAAAEAGLVVAPRILASGPGLTMTGGHVWMKCVQVDGPDEIRKEVRRQIREGVNWIKLMGVTGGSATAGQDIRRTQFTPEEIRAAADEAHRLGRRCAAHAHGLEGITACIDAGVDTIEHGTFLDDRQAARMAEKGLYLVPTLLNAYAQRQQLGDAPTRKRDAQLERMGVRIPEPEERMAVARRNGVKVLTGTDCGGNACARFGMHGIELYMLVECGFSPMEAICAATGLAAQAMDLAQETGTIRPGLAADLVVVDGDPLQDISILSPVNSRIDMVIKGGRVVHQRARAGEGSAISPE